MDAQAAGTDKGTKKCKFEIDQLFSSQLMSCRALVQVLSPARNGVRGDRSETASQWDLISPCGLLEN